MFSNRIVGDEQFLEMPVSTRELYFQLGMYADDDGFVNPRKVIRMIGSNVDDLKVLISKKFVIPFETGVVVITNWKENNYIQKDRYLPTIYRDEFNKLQCIHNVYILDTQVKLSKVKLSKDKELSKDSGKTTYGNQEINLLIEELKKVTNLKSLDGTIKENRQYAQLSIRKHGSEITLKAIRAAPLNDYWRSRATSMKQIYYNVNTIIQSYERENPPNIKIS